MVMHGNSLKLFIVLSFLLALVSCDRKLPAPKSSDSGPSVNRPTNQPTTTTPTSTSTTTPKVFVLAEYQARIKAASEELKETLTDAEAQAVGSADTDVQDKITKIKEQVAIVDQALTDINPATDVATAEPIAQIAESAARVSLELKNELIALMASKRPSSKKSESGSGAAKAEGAPPPPVDLSKVVAKADAKTKFPVGPQPMTNDVETQSPKEEHMIIQGIELSHIVTGFLKKVGLDKFETDLSFSLPALPAKSKAVARPSVMGVLTASGVGNLKAKENIPLLVSKGFFYRVSEVCLGDDCKEEYLEHPLFNDAPKMPLLTTLNDAGIEALSKGTAQVRLKFVKLGTQFPDPNKTQSWQRREINFPTHPGDNKALKKFVDEAYAKYKTKQKAEAQSVADFLKRIPLGNCQMNSLAGLELIRAGQSGFENVKFENNEHMALGYLATSKEGQHVVDLNAVNHSFNIFHVSDTQYGPILDVTFAVDLTGQKSPYLESRFTDATKDFMLENLEKASIEDYMIAKYPRENPMPSHIPAASPLKELSNSEIASVKKTQEYLRTKSTIINALKGDKAYKDVKEVEADLLQNSKIGSHCHRLFGNEYVDLCVMSKDGTNIFHVVVENYDYFLSKKGSLVFSVGKNGKVYRHVPRHTGLQYGSTVTFDAKEEEQNRSSQKQPLYMLQTLGQEASKLSFLNFPEYIEKGEESWFGVDFKSLETNEFDLQVSNIELSNSGEEAYRFVGSPEEKKAFAVQMTKYTYGGANQSDLIGFINSGAIVLVFGNYGSWSYEVVESHRDSSKIKAMDGFLHNYSQTDAPGSARLNYENEDQITKNAKTAGLIQTIRLYDMTFDLKMVDK